MSGPKVSVVVPAYGHARFIADALDSVFAQTFGDHEVVVVNDGSPDDTAEVVRPYAEAGRIRYVEQPNAGQASARNRGIDMARGEYVALLDDDDLWPADKLAWQVAKLDARPDVGLVFGYADYFGGDSRYRYPPTPPPADDVAGAFYGFNWAVSPGQTLIRVSALRRVGGFDPAVWGADDYDLYLRLAGVCEFAYHDRLALHYRRVGQGASRHVWRLHANLRRVQRRHTGGLLPRPGRLRQWRAARGFAAMSRSETAKSLAASARRAAADGDRGAARRDWLRALWLRPVMLRRPEVLAGLLRSLAPAAGPRPTPAEARP